MISVAISGASGPIIGIRLIEELLKAGRKTDCVVSLPAKRIIEYEIFEESQKFTTLKSLLETRNFFLNTHLLAEYENDDFFAPAASGSTKFEAAVVAPCSMKTVSAIVNGYADSLINRICDVALKEKRACVIVPRETPLSEVHTKNLHRAAKLGISVLMPVPGFYARPETADDIVNFIVGKILNLLDIDHNLFKSWDNRANQGV